MKSDSKSRINESWPADRQKRCRTGSHRRFHLTFRSAAAGSAAERREHSRDVYEAVSEDTNGTRWTYC